MISALAVRVLEVEDRDLELAVAGPAGNCHLVVVADRVVHVHEYIILSLVCGAKFNCQPVVSRLAVVDQLDRVGDLVTLVDLRRHLLGREPHRALLAVELRHAGAALTFLSHSPFADDGETIDPNLVDLLLAVGAALAVGVLEQTPLGLHFRPFVITSRSG